MRSVVQRVREARITVAGEEVAAMGPGLLALVGVARGDGPDAAAWLAAKLAHLRLFEDEERRMNRSLLEAGGTLAVVSQFTLLAETRKGRRPSFTGAAPPEEAAPLVEEVIRLARAEGLPVVAGRFRAVMDVQLCNQGPVTILLDSERP
jgi:D-tyrosyl-tRNA(Tyr) deacylase